MKSLVAVAVLTVIAVPVLASTQSSAASTSKPLAEVAKEEEARRKSVRRPARVYTNGDLRPDFGRPAPPAAAAKVTPDAPGNTSPSSPANASPSAPAGAAPPVAKDEAYWSGRMKELQSQLSRTQMFADALQSRINGLRTEFVNRDDPAQRDRIQADRNAALAELERVKKELEATTKAIADLQEEARKAGVPPGWLRPAA
jgi:hypothetical protein